MKRAIRAAAAAVAIVCLLTPLALASGLSGTYETTISKPAMIAGTYRLTFTTGHFVVHGPHGLVQRGTVRISGSKMTIRGVHGGGTCGRKHSGTYRFTLTATTVKFTKIKDPCGRALVLTAHPWKKV